MVPEDVRDAITLNHLAHLVLVQYTWQGANVQITAGIPMIASAIVNIAWLLAMLADVEA